MKILSYQFIEICNIEKVAKTRSFSLFYSLFISFFNSKKLVEIIIFFVRVSEILKRKE